MSMSDAVKAYLERSFINYRLLQQDAGLQVDEIAGRHDIALSAIARAGVVRDSQGLLLVVFPADRRVDLKHLNRQLQRDLKVLPPQELLKILQSRDPIAMPPLSELYGFPAIIDTSLDELDEVFFFDGSRDHLLAVSGDDFSQLQANAWHGSRFTTAYQEQRQPAEDNSATSSQAMLDKLANLDELPPMPEMAQKLLRLRNDPGAGAKQLAEVVEQDPSLTAQLIRYAESPLYGFRGEIQSIREVITIVLGYELVMDIALGVSLGRSFRNPVNGPLGLSAYWRHAVYSACLAQRLASVADIESRPEPGIAYLCGLLHNFGFLVMGHLYPDQFNRINDTYQRSPDVPITDIEKQVFQLSHDQIGAWLLDKWHLPAAVVTAAGEHHHLRYQGENAVYNNLVMLSNRLLKSYDIGDAETDEIPQALLDSLGLEMEKVEIIVQMLTEQGRDSLNQIATRMAA
jgi:HD-like signal output (HDOD) protein/prolyl-tRNA editing enzyme YbaK/EbsC (Cys-tRNA(Pro) deacylase)